jgi:sensor histidine kinase YesM
MSSCHNLEIKSGAPSAASESKMMRRTILGILLVLPAVALLIVLIFVTTGHARISETSTRFIGAFIYTVLIGAPSAVVLTWMNFRIAERMGRWFIAAEVVTLVVMASLGCLLAAYVVKVLGFIHSWRSESLGSLPFSILISLMVGLTMSTYQTLRYKLHFASLALRTQQMEQERANKLLAEARLSSLESRIHPHFLFNTLNSISALIPLDPKRAEDTVGKLASLLRFSLNATPSGLVPLEQEVKIVRDYLEIERTRFGARLRYEIDAPEALASVKTPPLALQCIVENSIKHVAAQRAEGASIRVAAQSLGDRVRIEVTDDGPGFTLESITPEHGLGNLVGRLELLYADRGQLSVSRRDNLTIVSLEYPIA